MAENGEAPTWHKAATCGSSACVEIAFTADSILVRDSEDPSGARLKFNFADWGAFIAGLRIETLTPPH